MKPHHKRHPFMSRLRPIMVWLLLAAAVLSAAFSVTLYVRRIRERGRIAYIFNRSALLSEEADARMKRNDRAGALESYEQLAALDPSSETAHIMAGILCAEAGDTEKAFAHFRAAIALKPFSGRAAYNLGNLHLLRKEYDAALQNYLWAANVNDRYIPPRLMLAKLYDARGEKEMARHTYEEIAAIQQQQIRELVDTPTIDPTRRRGIERRYNLMELFNTGFMLEREGLYAEAADVYTRVLGADPGFAAAFFRRGIARSRLGNRAAAEADMRRAVELNPQVHLAEAAFGDLLLREGKLDEAEAVFRNLAAAYPGIVMFRDYLGGLLLMQGDYIGAEKVYAALIEEHPDYSRAHEGMGNACLNLGLDDEAEQHYLTAISLDPDAPGPRYNLASLHALNGRREEALRLLREAVARGFNDFDFIRNDPNWAGLLDADLLREFKR